MASFTLHETSWAQDAPGLSAIRRIVFIDEQGVPESMEWDADDADSVHFLAMTLDHTPIGCARLLPDGHIGRMAVLPDWRGQGVGCALLNMVLRVAKAQGHSIVKLSAQTHAAAFYSVAGFVIDGAEYEEAGIPHMAMHMTLP